MQVQDPRESLLEAEVPQVTLHNFLEDVLCDNTINSLCWQGQCHTCANGKLIKPTMDPGATIQDRQWETIIKESVRRADQDPGNNAEPNKVYKMLELVQEKYCNNS